MYFDVFVTEWAKQPCCNNPTVAERLKRPPSVECRISKVASNEFHAVYFSTPTKVFLVNATDLYVYNGADLFGVDSWIPVRDCVDMA